METILIIGAGWEQVPLIQKAKEMGLFIIATNPTSGVCEGSKYADITFTVDPLNFLELDKLFRKYNPYYVVSDACDYSMLATSYLTQKFCLPGISTNTALVCSNKYLQREAVKEVCEQPKYRLCSTLDELKSFVYEVGLPLIIKPLSSRGGINISVVDSGLKLYTSFFVALSNSLGRSVIAEQYIPGIMVNVEGIYLDKHYTLSYGIKIKHPIYHENAMHIEYPGWFDETIKNKIFETNDRVIEALGINCGLTHTEYILSENEELYFIEGHNRGCGVRVASQLIPAITGIDTIELLIRQAMGENLKIDVIEQRGFGVLHFFDFGTGYVGKIYKQEEIPTYDGVLYFRLNIEPGSKLPEIRTALERPGFVIVARDTRDECNKLIKRIENTLIVETKDTSMTYSGMAQK